MKLPISVFIITKNEADRIATIIKSVQSFADEIIVIDSGSTDNTVKISQELNTAVVFNEWKGYGAQKIFGENLYAVHSIAYPELENHFYVFAIRQNGIWLSWNEVVEWANFFDFPTVPVIIHDHPKEMVVDGLYDMESYAKHIIKIATEPSVFGSMDVYTGLPCSREGIVSRNADAFPVDKFKENVFKYVRKGHVKTTEHWNRNWKRAPLKWEKKS